VTPKTTADFKYSLTPRQINIELTLKDYLPLVLPPNTLCLACNKLKNNIRHVKEIESIIINLSKLRVSFTGEFHQSFSTVDSTKQKKKEHFLTYSRRPALL
jgi:thioredoxin-related protein